MESRQDQVFQFDWFQLFVGVSAEIWSDFTSIEQLTRYLVHIFDSEEEMDLVTLLKTYNQLLENDTLGRLMNAMYGLLDALKSYVINSGAAEDIYYIRINLIEIETIKLISDSMLKLPIKPLMKDWNEVSDYLIDNLYLEPPIVESIGEAFLDVPKVKNGIGPIVQYKHIFPLGV